MADMLIPQELTLYPPDYWYLTTKYCSFQSKPVPFHKHTVMLRMLFISYTSLYAGGYFYLVPEQAAQFGFKAGACLSQLSK